MELSCGDKFMGSLIFHLSVIVKDIYRSKSRNMCGQIIMHSTTNYFIYLTMRKYKVLQTCRLQTGQSRLVSPDSSVYRASSLWLNHMHRSLSFDFSFSPWVPLLSNVCVCICLSVCNLNYKMLLLSIGNLRIATTWADWLAIKDCNNYLPNNLASEINLTCLQCWIVDSSFLSDCSPQLKSPHSRRPWVGCHGGSPKSRHSRAI